MTRKDQSVSTSSLPQKDEPLPGGNDAFKSLDGSGSNDLSSQESPTPLESKVDSDPLGSLLAILDSELERVSVYFETTERSIGTSLSLLSHYLEEEKEKQDPFFPTLEKDRREIRRILQGLTTLPPYIQENWKLLLRQGELLHKRYPEDPRSIRYTNEGPIYGSTRIFSSASVLSLDRMTTQANAIYRAIEGKWEQLCPKSHRLTTLMAMERRDLQNRRKYRSLKDLWEKYHIGNILWFLVALLVLILLVALPVLWSQEQSRCLALLLFASILWATEALPLYVTSLMIPILVVLLGVLVDPNTGRGPIPPQPLPALDASKAIASSMFSPIILLLLGGFSIAAAMERLGIASRLAKAVLKRAGKKPSTIILVIMLFATVVSGLVSNVTAPVLCLGIVRPILRTRPHTSRMAKALVMGIALASCIGGMATPIASPQNVIAISLMQPSPSWGAFLAVSIPVCLLCNVMVWGFLLLIYRPNQEYQVDPTTPPIPDPDLEDGCKEGTVKGNAQVEEEKDETPQAWGFKHTFAVVITVLTIGLWCVAGLLESIVGDMGMIALLPLIAFFGSGILNKEDLHRLPWPVVVLAMGGMALGKAVSSSGLLSTVAQGISGAIGGVSLWSLVWMFSAVIGVIATFVSHTVTAMVLLPVVAEVGANLSDPHPRLLVMVSDECI